MIKRRPGFALIDVVTSLAVLGSLAIIGTRLFQTGLRLTHQSVAAEETTIRFRSAVGSLRADIWNAKEFTLRESHLLHVVGASGNSVDWTIGGNDLVRSENGEQRRWAGVAEGCAFEVDGFSVVLDSVIRGETAQLRLISQFQLASQESP
jgi:hypothetical protein